MSKTTVSIAGPPDPEVEATPRRRTFTAEYKAKILAECDSASEPGAIGSILRREGLYSSHLVDWRRRRAVGGPKGLAPHKTGRPPTDRKARALEKDVERLERENARLQERLRHAEVIIEAQKKLSELLALLPSTPPQSES